MAGNENVSVVISGKETVSTAAKTAEGALNKLNNTAKESQKGLTLGDIKAGWLAFAAIATKVAGEVTKVLGAMNNAYAEEETNFLKMTAAARSNPLLSGEFATSMRSWAEANQYALGVSHDQIEAQAALAGAMGRTQKQIEGMALAAQNLAAGGHGSFESNMEALSRSYEGTVSTLGRALPGLKNFTKEQLEAGAAIEYVNRKFAGMADAAMQGLEGSRKAAKIAQEELLASAGALTAPIEKFANRAFVLISKQIADGLNAGFDKSDSDGWLRRFLFDVNRGLVMVGAAIASVFNVIGETFKLMALQAKLEVQKVFNPDAVKTTMAEVAIQREAVLRASTAPMAQDRYMGQARDAMNAGMSNRDLVLMMTNLMAADPMHSNEIKRAFEAAIGLMTILPREVQAGAANGTNTDNLKKAIDTFFRRTDTAIAIVGDKTAKRISETLFKAVGGGDNTGINRMQLGLSNNSVTNMAESIGKHIASVVPTSAGGATPDNTIGQRVASLFGPVVEALSKGDFVGAVFAIIGSLQSLKPILDFMGRLLAVVDTFLAPLITMMQPILGFVTVIGRMLGAVITPILEALAPVIKIVAWALLFLYNFAIMPIANVIIFVVKLISNIVAFVYNAISAIVFTLTLGIVNMGTQAYQDMTTGYLAPISMDTLNESGSDTSASTTGGTTVTQMKQPDIYITQYFMAPVVGEGGMRQVGEYVVEAVQEYASYGGKVTWNEATS
jgi:hypothetical protein